MWSVAVARAVVEALAQAVGLRKPPDQIADLGALLLALLVDEDRGVRLQSGDCLKLYLQHSEFRPEAVEDSRPRHAGVRGQLLHRRCVKGVVLDQARGGVENALRCFRAPFACSRSDAGMRPAT
jgi:hypothetical protein